MAKRATTASRASRTSQPVSVDAYLASVPPPKRAALQRLRKTIRAILPEAEECISYGMPGYRWRGKMLVWFGAAAGHCSFFPGGVVDECREALARYETSKGTVRFAPDQPLPATLVRALIKARIARVFPGGRPARRAKAR